MRLLTLEEKKQMELEMLHEIDALCKEHEIKYYLAYGTLIGALRHKGFIPWDDDIDLWIPAEDYLRLLDVLNRDSKYDLLNNMTNPNWPRVFSKLCYPRTQVIDLRKNVPNLRRGLGVDLFPLFNISNFETDYKEARRIIRQLNGFAHLDGGVHIKSLSDLALISEAKLNRWRKRDVLFWQNKFWGINATGHTNQVSYLGSKYGAIDVHDAILYRESIFIEFEDGKYPAPCGYDQILWTIYGDYMQMPPEEKQVTVHDVDVYIDG